MNSLFVRTLLWFIVTVVLTFVALTIAAVLDTDRDERRPGPFRGLVSISFQESVEAYRTGGKPALQAVLQQFTATTGYRAILTDARGTDLLTGEDRRPLISEMYGQRRSPMWARSRTIFGRQSPTGEYRFFVLIERRSLARLLMEPEIPFAALGVLVILSYLFARRLTDPVRQLRDAVDSFGRGDLAVRLKSKRGDELGDLGRAFDQMAGRIQTLLAAERRLLLDISHELRSPLARLSVAVELARTADDPGRYLDRIEKEAARLNSMVGELLQVTRAEGDAARMRFQTVDLRQLILTIVEDAQLEATQRGSRLEWMVPEELAVNGDAELLRRAIENAVRNAIRYAPSGTAVEVSAIEAQGSVVIKVRDHGPGVPVEHLARIFDPFFRVEPDRDRASGGTGLGLAIAKRAIDLHHGSITARNASPGLEVEIQLPASGK